MNKKPLLLLLALTIFMIGYWIPEDRHVPVEGAQVYDLNTAAYAYKVGGLNAQKGINIFANKGTAVEATTSGLVLYHDSTPDGEHSVWVLGAKWRLHHYANLEQVSVKTASWVKTGQKIGNIGAPDRSSPVASSLYYSIRSLPPQVTEWKPEQSMGLDQVFYVNPHEFLTAYQNDNTAHKAPNKKDEQHP
ncbi:M23 family metallopeptidase [Thiothrix lacustris]|jgi:murein DD-endopeptidase MepM/ murein hydrolase activator NlpD|uniref:M23 family metallopeptidase n=1 Tax=Thiothrix lacustris TaxID=525917 RepID=UPI0027E5AB3D|nr:M23 family metallopeptidase [Thiothrix lacustris]WMP19287.1 M23 family metallopeptidase [Thiothrix lacustris]